MPFRLPHSTPRSIELRGAPRFMPGALITPRHTTGARISMIDEIDQGAATAAVTISFVGTTEDTTSQSTYTFSSVSLGTVKGNRTMLVVAASRGGSAGVQLSMTIAGNAATQIVQEDDGANANEVALYALDDSTNATGDIVCVYGASKGNCGIAVYTMYAGSATAHATGVSQANPLTASINVPAKGIAIGAANGGTSPTFTWSGIDEDFDKAIEGTESYTGASKEFADAVTPQTITATQSANNNPNFICASFPQV